MDYERIIITGASSGLGAAFAEALASGSREMYLLARRQDRLEQLAERLQRTHAASALAVHVLPCDLSDPADRQRAAAQLCSLPEARTLLVNNAGLGDYGSFLDSDPQKTNALMQVNMLALVELSRALAPGMARTGGGIINIASLAADVFLPDFALYAASKSFVASFSEALHIELRDSGVRVLAVCPGPVHTEFGSVARRTGFDSGDIPLKPLFYTPIHTVVQGSLRALNAGKSRYYPSAKIGLAGCLLRFMPLWLMRLILNTRPRRVKQQGGDS